MKIRTLQVWSFALGLAALVAAHPAKADIPGDYNVTQRVDGGAVKYTLKLKDNGDAELTSERQDKPRLEDGNLRKYGQILDKLDRDGKAVHTGKWRKRSSQDSEFVLSFDRLRYGSRDDREQTDVDGNLTGDKLEFTRWDENLYGRDTDFHFSRIKKSRNNNALIAGAAVLALGAVIIANSHKGHSSDTKNFSDLTVENSGYGSYSVAGSAPQNIQRIRVELRKGGDARLTVWLYRGSVNLNGRWRHDGDKQIWIDLEKAQDNDRINGSGTVILRSTSEIDRINLNYTRRNDHRRSSINFNARRD